MESSYEFVRKCGCEIEFVQQKAAKLDNASRMRQKSLLLKKLRSY